MLGRRLPLPLHGSGHHRRRYLYASDAADAFDTILHRGKIGEAYNIGSPYELSNSELCIRLLREFGVEGEDEVQKWVQHTKDRPFNDSRYAVDSRKLESLGWRPKVDLEEGLSKTVDWYRKFGEEWWGDVGKVLVAHPTDAEIKIGS